MVGKIQYKVEVLVDSFNASLPDFQYDCVSLAFFKENKEEEKSFTLQMSFFLSCHLLLPTRDFHFSPT